MKEKLNKGNAWRKIKINQIVQNETVSRVISAKTRTILWSILFGANIFFYFKNVSERKRLTEINAKMNAAMDEIQATALWMKDGVDMINATAKEYKEKGCQPIWKTPDVSSAPVWNEVKPLPNYNEHNESPSVSPEEESAYHEHAVEDDSDDWGSCYVTCDGDADYDA